KLDDEFFQKRLVDVEWNNPKKSKFEGEIKIVATDRKSMLSDVTHMIAVQKLNINGINARKTKEGITHINLLIEVNDISELTNLMKKLKAIPGVDDVFRVRN
ncbi:(p)ppGpp synthetase, partial [Clostridium perfringens]